MPTATLSTLKVSGVDYQIESQSTPGGGTITTTTDTVPDFSDWDIIWEAGVNTADRIASANTNDFRTTNRPLGTGKRFSDFDFLAAWIDNSTGVEGKFMYLEMRRFENEFSYVSGSGGWVDWSDNRWIGISYQDDTNFRFRGNGMGLRKIFGIENKTVVTGLTGGPAGIHVEGNPVDAGTQSLSKLTVGTTTYNIVAAASGLTQAEVDARIHSWARSGDTTTDVPLTKIPTMDSDHIPNLSAGKITTGILGTSRIPNLPAEQDLVRRV